MVSFRFIIATVVVGAGTLTVSATTTIDSANKYAYSATIGWVNAEGDTVNGAVIGQSFCTDNIYSANCGWISLGNSPTNGWQYSNLSDNDWGVNHDGAGNLSGYAYAANIGWITFEQTRGRPQIDLLTGTLDGYVWSANTGWISLSNAQAFVRTETLDAGPDLDSDGIPDAWEYGHTNVLASLAGGDADFDDDGVSDLDEYKMDTDPLNPNDFLWVKLNQVRGSTNTLSWPTRPTRLYQLQSVTALTTGEWANTSSGLLHDNAGMLIVHDEPAVNSPARFYRVNAILPLK